MTTIDSKEQIPEYFVCNDCNVLLQKEWLMNGSCPDCGSNNIITEKEFELSPTNKEGSE